MHDIATMFNRSSTAKYLISYKKPSDITNEYMFQVKLIGKLQTTMHGSQRHHTCYIFGRVSNDNAVDAQQPCLDSDMDSVPCDQIFQDAWDCCMTGSFDKNYERVELQVDIFYKKKSQGRARNLTC